MSYDLALCDAITNEPLQLDAPHQMKGGTYAVGGCHTAEINITYNYADHFRRVLGKEGIRSIYGMTGAESVAVLTEAASQLGNDIDDDYWRPT